MVRRIHRFVEAQVRVLVFGRKGILGATIMQLLPAFKHVGYFPDDSCAYDNSLSLKEILHNINPHAIINCAGADTSNVQMIRLNSLFPHLLASSTEVPILHASTDRVFNGKAQKAYITSDVPDAIDMFGKTKALGEVRAPHVHNVRFSFIARDRGFVQSLIRDTATFKGLTNVMFTGSTVEAVAIGFIKMLDFLPGLHGVEHLATDEPISRYEAARLVLERFGIEDTLEQFSEPIDNRSLCPTFTMPSLATALQEWNTTPVVVSEQ